MGILFLLSVFWQDLVGLVVYLVVFGSFVIGMMLMCEGLQVEVVYDVCCVVWCLVVLCKLFGGILIGFGLVVGFYVLGVEVGVVVIGVVVGVLYWLFFGLDLMCDKGMEGIDIFQQDRVYCIIGEGEVYLVVMQDVILCIGDCRLDVCVGMFVVIVCEFFVKIEQDFGDILVIWCYLGIYLQGVCDVMVKFVDFYVQICDFCVWQDYEILLSDFEMQFVVCICKLVEGDKVNLDIEISVLCDCLLCEGVCFVDMFQFLDLVELECLMIFDDLLILCEIDK